MADNFNPAEGENLLELPGLKDVAIAPAHGIAGLALNFALKYHDMAICKDGVMYQQKKMEGKNFVEIHEDMVLTTAARFELWLMRAPQRLEPFFHEAVENAAFDLIEQIAKGLDEDHPIIDGEPNPND